MPKKKLTKAQVKRKLKTIEKAMYDLFIDKYGHKESFVPMSVNKMIEYNNVFGRAFRKLK